MIRFALKNMGVKKAQMIFVILSIVISAGIAVLAYNTGSQISDGITGTAGYYSAIIGPAGSKTQLAMNTMYFTDEPLGTIPYAIMGELQRDSRVTAVIPFAEADSFNGYNIVGTTSAFLDNKAVADGEMFDDSGSLEVVLGATVARTCQVSVGDQIYTSHSAGEEHKTPLTVTGILEETHTVYDTTVFTQLQTIWDVHEEEEEEEEEHEDHEEHAENGMVCSFLVKTLNPSYAMTLVNDYNGKIYTDRDGDSWQLQAIEPMSVVRSVLEDANTTKYVAYILCAVILFMNIIIISIITLLNMINSAKEISLMRLIGISMKKINLLYILQNGIVGLISTVLAFGLSRLLLSLMGDYVSKMGVILDVSKIYGPEWIILLAVFLISILPTVVCTFLMSKKDSI